MAGTDAASWFDGDELPTWSGPATVLERLPALLEPLTAAQRRRLQEIARRLVSAAGAGRPWRPPGG